MRRQAQRLDGKVLFRFYDDGITETARSTYGELDRRARSLAAEFRRHADPGDRVLLLHPPGLEFIEAFLGCLVGGLVAVPSVPPGSRRGLPRLASIARDCRPALISTTRGEMDRLHRLGEPVAGLSHRPWIGVDEVPLREDRWAPPDLGPDSLAFLQYTSGSTGDPKGVRVTHGNLLANEESIRRAFGQDEDSVVVGWLPVFHDMGLIGNVLQPLYTGATCHLMPPLVFLQKPLRWLRLLSGVGGTTSGGPDFAYGLCVEKTSAEDRESLDLSSWRVAFSGAEPVRSSTLTRFAEAFAPSGFRSEAFLPCYGLAEATLLVSGTSRPEGARTVPVDARALDRDLIRPPEHGSSTRWLVSCGAATGVREVVVVSPETGRPMEPGRVGELWVTGEGVADGYWDRPEDTDQTFRAFTADGRGPYLRTGDLGFLDGGEVVVTGRWKDLVILRGRNVYPQDVEAASSSSHEGLVTAGAAAFSIDDGEREALVVVQEVERTHRRGDLGAMAEAIRQRVVEELEVDPWKVVLVLPGQVPRTTSGKVRRSACRRAWRGGRLVVLYEAGTDVISHGFQGVEGVEDDVEPSVDADTESTLCVVSREARRVLGVTDLDPDAPLVLDSLKALELSGRLEAKRGQAPPLAVLLAHESPRRIAVAWERGSDPDGQMPRAVADPVPSRGARQASAGQRALWLLDRMAPVAGAYHVAVAVRPSGDLTPSRLEDAFRALQNRHAALRTVLPERDGELERRVLDDPPVPLLMERGPVTPDRLADEAERPFDLETGPSYRLHWFDEADGAVLLLVFHHAVVDLTSLLILARDLGALWSDASEDPPRPQAGYDEFVDWQRQVVEGPLGRRLLDEWAYRLAGAPDLELPTDRPRPVEASFRGAVRTVQLPRDTWSSLCEVAARRRTTPFVVLLAAFSSFLGRLAGQRDVVVGTPVSGRVRPELRDVVGYLTQPLPLRLDLGGDPSFNDLIDRARDAATWALERQALPFPRLVERLAPERDAGRSPVFQALFAWQSGATPALGSLGAFALGRGGLEARWGDVSVRSVAVPRRRAQFDLSLHAAEGPDGWLGVLEYATDLFDAVTTMRWAADLELRLASLAVDPVRPVSLTDGLSSAQRHQLVCEWNDSPGWAPEADGTLVHDIRRAARRYPDGIAVRLGSRCLSYRELLTRAESLGRRLIESGVQPDDPVAVLMDRSVEMAVVLVAILEAGAAYVPLSPDDPPQRWAELAGEIRPAVVIADRDPRVPYLDSAGLLRIQHRVPALRPLRPVPGESLAYVLFTSGSTGRPKAVAIPHRGIVNRLRWMQEVYELKPGEPVLHKTPWTFDVSVWELFWPLCTGATLVFAPPGAHRDPTALRRIVVNQQITTLHFVPSVLQLFAEEPDLERCRSLRRVIASGEALPADLARRFLQRWTESGAPGPLLDNLYGPTEASVDVTYQPCRLDEIGSAVPIGRPIRATRVYVVTTDGGPAPIGVAGELFLSGVQLARGYSGRPATTAERFVPDAFSTGDGDRAYRTGDRVRWTSGGALEFLGRLDHQVKIRGVRVEPGEVAMVLESHPSVREAAVLAVTEPGRETRLAAWVTLAEPVDPEDVIRHVAGRLPSALVPSGIQVLPALPLQPNGKLDRRRLLESLEALPSPGSASAEPPRTPTEVRLSKLWQGLLDLNAVPGRDASFFDLGGHSLLAARLVARVRRDFRVELSVADVFREPVLRAMAERIGSAEAVTDGPRPESASPGSPRPLSFAQERLWFLQQLDPESTAYHMPATVVFRGDLSARAMSEALRGVVERHEVLRTRFPEHHGRPRVETLATSSIPGGVVPRIDLTGVRARDRDACRGALSDELARRSFDLETIPPVRFRLVRGDGDRWDLLLCLHHAVADGWSLNVFLQELAASYETRCEGRPESVPRPPVQYADFAAWQRRRADLPSFERRLAAYADRVREAPTVLELPTDGVRGVGRTYRSARVTHRLRSENAEMILHRAGSEGVTPFVFVASVWILWLARWTGRRDFLWGTPVAGRPRPELEALIGLFVEPMVLRARLEGVDEFRALLHRTRDVAWEALADQDLPFERLVEAVAPERDPSRTPLFQVFFNWLDFPLGDVRFPGLAASVEARGETSSKYELTLYAQEADGTIRLDLVYDADLFSNARMEEAARQLGSLLWQTATDPAKALASYSLVTEAAASILPDPKTPLARPRRTEHVLERLREHARTRPDRPAVEGEDGSLTYGELQESVDVLGAALTHAGIGREDRVLVWADRHRSLPVALLGVWRAGAAFVILDPAYPEARLLDAVGQIVPAGCILLESAGEMPEGLARKAASLPCWTVDRAGRLHRPPKRASASWTGPSSRDLAYVAFTSGSTGRPKGIEGEHGPVSAFLDWQSRTFELGPDDRGSLWSGLSHDPLLRDVLAPLWNGGTLCVPEDSTLASPPALRRWIARHGITCIHATPARLRMLIDDELSEPVPRAETVRHVFVGGDVLTGAVVDAVVRIAPEARCVNVYGATETPQFQAWEPIRETPAFEARVPLGRGIDGVDLVIRADERRCGIGELGEIHVRGPYLARGYWDDPDATARSFRNGEYATGDLGRYLPDGRVELVGRSDLQVNVRGYRVEPTEVEAVLVRHPAVDEAIVGLGADGGLRAHLTISAERRPPVKALRKFLGERLPEHMIPSAFDVIETMPRDSRGKVDRRRVSELSGDRLGGEETATAPRTSTEERLASIWSRVLGVRGVGRESHFFELGGHSLLATQVLSRIRTVFELEAPLHLLFERPVLADLAAAVEELRDREASNTLPPLESSTPEQRRDSTPLSWAQRRIWFLEQLEPGNPTLHLSAALRLGGALEPWALRDALSEIVRRHETLRTTFEMEEGRPRQRIHDEEVGSSASLPHRNRVVDLSGLEPRAGSDAVRGLAAEESWRSFDLETGPVFRTVLVRLDRREHTLLLSLHHIVSDGWSTQVLGREISALYEAYHRGRPSPLEELSLQYVDFARWQVRWLRDEALEDQLAYWRERLRDDPPVLELVPDRPRPAVRDFRGARHRVRLPAKLTRRLGTLGRLHGGTPFMVLLAAFKAVLFRATGQRDLVVGAPVAHRVRTELEDLIGMFFNLLALRTRLDGEPSFGAWLDRVADTARGAFSHQDLPFERLLEEIQPGRHLARTPLFQITFVLQNAPPAVLGLDDLEVERVDLHDRAAHFDLNLQMWEDDGELVGWLEYRTELFDATTIQRLGDQLGIFLEAVSESPDMSVADVRLVSAGQRHQILREWNDTAAREAPGSRLHDAFEARAAERPDAVASICRGTTWTYGRMRSEARRLARALEASGVRAGEYVAVLLDRSHHLPTTLLAVSMSGGAYVPLEPDLPSARTRFVLESLRIRHVVTQASHVDEHAGPDTPVEHVFCLDERPAVRPACRMWGPEDVASLPDDVLPAHAGPGDLAYVIFTSGSTGTPKGVMVRHRPAVHLVGWVNRAFGVGPEDRVLFVTSPSFDLSVYDVFGILAAGGSIRIAVEDEIRDPTALVRALLQEPITFWDSAPAALRQLVPYLPPARDLPRPASLRRVFLSGDWIPVSLPDQIRQTFPAAQIVSLGGATEATVWSNVFPVDEVPESWISIPYGRPMPNARYHVLDGRLEPTPVGVPGDLYIGGLVVTSGYAGRPTLTARRYLPDPWSERPGGRLYDTGDRARHWADGTLEFLGRLDQQVKVRGYRIELGEIETVAAEHPGVEDVAVVARSSMPDETSTGEHRDKRLAAYVVPADGYAAEADDGQVEAWSHVYDETYRRSEATDPTFDVSGWVSSYTGEPLPESHMREWVETTVDRIRELTPRRVLEIGCGTGLLLFRVAPECEDYLGTDISAVTLDRLQGHVAERGLSQVRLEVRPAHDWTEIEPGSFDLVVLNSVTQHFPSAEYLERVLDGAVTAVVPGGAVFVGDNRSFRLLEAFHASVELERAPGSLPLRDFQRRIWRRRLEEEELVLDPRFFEQWAWGSSAVGRVRTEIRRGRSDDELTRFRFDATLFVEDPEITTPTEERCCGPDFGPHALRGLLADRPDRVRLRDVPSARLAAVRALLEALGEDSKDTVDGLRRRLETENPAGIHPDDLRRWADDLGYVAEVSEDSVPGFLEIDLRRRDVPPGRVPRPDSELTGASRANDPMRALAVRRLPGELRRHLGQHLPDYMLPSVIELLPELPVTSNGKLDRSALPEVDGERPRLEQGFVAPRDAVETLLARTWSEVLGIGKVGIHDNFFELGGDSILSIQVLARVAEQGLHVEPRQLFEHQTIAALRSNLGDEVTLHDPWESSDGLPDGLAGSSGQEVEDLNDVDLSDAEFDTLLDQIP